MDKIVINKVYRKDNILYCEIELAGQDFILWAEVQDEYSQYLTDDRADGFFVICAFKCFKEGYSLE